MLFVFGTFWFWVLTAAAIIIIMGFAENDRGFEATVCLVIYAGILHYAGGLDLGRLLLYHPVYFVLVTAGYFAIGATWMVLRWALFVKEKMLDLEERVRDFCTEAKLPFSKPLTHETWEAFKGSNWAVLCKEQLTTPVRIRDHKGRAINWMAFWPVSMLWTLIHDFVVKICRHVYTALAGHLQAISDNIYGKIVPKAAPKEVAPEIDGEMSPYAAKKAARRRALDDAGRAHDL